MHLRKLHHRIFVEFLYRRILLRPSRPNEHVVRSKLKKFVAVAWDNVLNRPFESRRDELDLVCVVPAGSKGWILDAICKEILQTFPGKGEIYYGFKNLPMAKAYFLSHYMLMKDAALYSPHILRKNIGIWYTHPREIGLTKADLIYWLNQSHVVIATCSRFEEDLILDGVRPEKVATVIGGADPDFFTGHQRAEDGAVGFCSAYYERKDPDRILEIVKNMPHRKFILMGRNWNQYPRFDELMSLKNFQYEEASYKDYPAFYARLSVFVSPARLEGGPIPLIEAMMENVVPVASDTGFARDIIQHAKNGYLFPVDAPIAEICDFIDRAYEITIDVRASVSSFNWDNFSSNVQALLLKTRGRHG